MSKRLYNILVRNGIFYLSEISNYSFEALVHLRNMGIKTYKELENICSTYEIAIATPIDIPESLKRIKLPPIFLHKCVLENIQSLSEMNNLTSDTVYQMCNKNYNLTAKVWLSLHKLGLQLTKWEDVYLFEVFPLNLSLQIHSHLHVKTLSELSKINPEKLRAIHGIGEKKLNAIEHLIKNHVSLLSS